MIIKIQITLLLVIILLSTTLSMQINNVRALSIVPVPLSLEVAESSFDISESTAIIVESNNPKVKEVADYFAKQLNKVSGFSIKVITQINTKEENNLILFTDQNLDSSLSEEGYSLKSDSEAIVLTGTPHGLFYGVQTLFQLLPKEVFSSTIIPNTIWSVPAVEIKDKPRFQWRGMHLDVGRHLFPISFIKKYIDYIAMHKMNTFHWHLTEDQGWRIEIKKYSKLTEIGGWRKGTQIGKTAENDGNRYGGYYTQDEIKEVVKYAAERFVTIVPEIEMPGHSVAALASYPELSCTGGPFEVRSLWGISDDIYCAGNDSVFTFLENVLTEVMDLFPSKYIHIGGDEAPKERWEKCSKCQLRINKERLKDEQALQSYFISRIEKFLNSKGRQIIGWDEILEGGLAPNAAVMSWRGIEGGISAAKQKHNVVMTPTDYCYFDYYQGEPDSEPLAIGGFLPLEKVYSYEPIPSALNSDEAKYIMGVQANQWTEYIDSPELVEYMTLPRLCAIAEVAWSPKEKKDLIDFGNRMSEHYGRFDELGVNYRWPSIRGIKRNKVFTDSAIVKIFSGKKGSELHYTLDGTDPTENSPIYNVPLTFRKTTLLKVKEFSVDGSSSQVYKANYTKQDYFKPISINTTKNGLQFEYFELSKPINSVLELENLKPIKEGTVYRIEYPFEDNVFPDQFGLSYYGYVKVPIDAVYSFSVLSNDGSRLYINDTAIVENDGPHGAFEKEGEIALKAGLHKIKLLYYQAGGGKTLHVYMKNNYGEKKELPEGLLRFDYKGK